MQVSAEIKGKPIKPFCLVEEAKKKRNHNDHRWCCGAGYGQDNVDDQQTAADGQDECVEKVGLSKKP